MKIKKGDTILVISGKYKGKTGKVLKSFPQTNKILVEGVNVIKKHLRAKKAGEKGQILAMPSAFYVSKVKIVCPHCKKGVRVGYDLKNGEKVRICKKCKKEL